MLLGAQELLGAREKTKQPKAATQKTKIHETLGRCLMVSLSLSVWLCAVAEYNTLIPRALSLTLPSSFALRNGRHPAQHRTARSVNKPK